MTKRVLIGKFPDGGYGVRVSKPGYDVSSNPVDNELLAFNSDWSYMLPVLLSGTIAVTGTSTVNFGLDLGYVPFCSAFLVAPSYIEAYYTSNTVDPIPAMNEYWTEGINAPIVDIGTFSDRIVFTTSSARTIKYFVYRLKAF